MLLLGLPPLSAKLASDTLTDRVRWKDLPASQEAMGVMLNLKAPKYHMSVMDWDLDRRSGDRSRVRKRVTADVTQHMELRAELIRRGWLKPPTTWRP